MRSGDWRPETGTCGRSNFSVSRHSVWWHLRWTVYHPTGENGYEQIPEKGTHALGRCHDAESTLIECKSKWKGKFSPDLRIRRSSRWWSAGRSGSRSAISPAIAYRRPLTGCICSSNNSWIPAVILFGNTVYEETGFYAWYRAPLCTTHDNQHLLARQQGQCLLHVARVLLVAYGLALVHPPLRFLRQKTKMASMLNIVAQRQAWKMRRHKRREPAPPPKYWSGNEARCKNTRRFIQQQRIPR